MMEFSRKNGWSWVGEGDGPRETSLVPILKGSIIPRRNRKGIGRMKDSLGHGDDPVGKYCG